MNFEKKVRKLKKERKLTKEEQRKLLCKLGNLQGANFMTPELEEEINLISASVLIEVLNQSTHPITGSTIAMKEICLIGLKNRKGKEIDQALFDAARFGTHDIRGKAQKIMLETKSQELSKLREEYLNS